ncbi:hypothetical protein PVAP13_7KG377100 [Panicum virgatum]|uniref:Uncharacterized protein n=1 Tax=Panicum virgatum TaxID=38727 RepID=A0A8T0QRB7_PANVG|nr:hypothetical protein PVAP13_7KG377100 [Panicum virgatum]
MAPATTRPVGYFPPAIYIPRPCGPLLSLQSNSLLLSLSTPRSQPPVLHPAGIPSRSLSLSIVCLPLFFFRRSLWSRWRRGGELWSLCRPPPRRTGKGWIKGARACFPQAFLNCELVGACRMNAKPPAILFPRELRIAELSRLAKGRLYLLMVQESPWKSCCGLLCSSSSGEFCRFGCFLDGIVLLARTNSLAPAGELRRKLSSVVGESHAEALAWFNSGWLLRKINLEEFRVPGKFSWRVRNCCATTSRSRMKNSHHITIRFRRHSDEN